MRRLDERTIASFVEIRDHPIVKDCSTSLHIALGEVLENVAKCLREKTEKATMAYEGYMIWRARGRNYVGMLMDMRKRKLASDSKFKIISDEKSKEMV